MAINLYALADALGIDNMQQGVGHFFKRFLASYSPRPLLRSAFLTALFPEAPSESMNTLRAALDEVEGHEQLLLFSHFMVDELCKLPLRLSYDDYEAMIPYKAMKHSDLYAFLLLLASMEPSFERLRATGMPDSYFVESAYSCARRQMQRFCDTGDGRIADFPWDRNFYTCGLFRLGRFLFKLERFWHNLAVYRRDTETVAFYTEPCQVRSDGQLNGVNGWHDKNAFTAVYKTTAAAVSGYPISPAGVISPEMITLDKKQWRLVLKEDDITLGLHIPSGPGYDPAHLHADCQEAAAFFARWFPQRKVKAFSNESWLNDPHIPALTGGEGNIARMQQQMYLFPMDVGDSMTMDELFPHGRPEKPTRLQRAAAEYMDNGGRFTVSGMFILTTDIPLLGQGPYAERAVYENVWKSYA